MAKYKLIKAKPISYGGTRRLDKIRWIVIHYTGNDSRTDTAKAECSFFKNGNTRNAGAHFFVDQYGLVFQSIPMERTAWSVGGFFTQANGAGEYYKKCLNSNSISIEMCDCASRDPSDKMIAAVKELVKYIQSQCPNAKNIVTHWQVNGKKCPARMVGTNNKKWIEFKAQITGKSAASIKTAATKKAAAYPTTTLRYGSTGEQVVKLQKCLNKIMGTSLKIDGSFGSATEKEVKRFQKKYGLEVDGIAGPKTRAKMKTELEKRK